MNLRALWLKRNARGQFAGEAGYALEDAFGLAPRRTHDAHGAVLMRHGVPQEQSRHDEALAALPAPTCSRELVLFEYLDELFLVGKRLETQDFSAEDHGVSAEVTCFLQRLLLNELVILLDSLPLGQNLVGTQRPWFVAAVMRHTSPPYRSI